MRCVVLLLLSVVVVSTRYTAPEKRKQVCMIDLVLVVDRSGSINDDTEENWNDVKQFLKTIVDSYTIGKDDTRIAMVTYSDKARLEFGFGGEEPHSKEAMNNKIDDIRRPEGYTATAAALDEALSILNDDMRESSSKVVLLITDGLPTQNREGLRIEDGDHDEDTEKKRKEFIKEVIDQGIKIQAATGAKILALGVTDHVNSNLFLKDLADPDSYFKSDNFDDLIDTVSDITNSSCKTVPTGSCTLDVAFAVDMSGSVHTNAKTLKDFVETLNKQLEAMDPRIHTGLIRFANKAKILKPFSAYDVEAMPDAIEKMSGPSGYTATADALVEAQKMFSGNDGDRPGKGNVLVLLTDGLPSKKLNGQTIEPTSPLKDKELVYEEVEKEADKLIKSGVEIFSVLVEGKTGFDKDLLEKISSVKPVRVEEFSALLDKLQTIKDGICVEAPAESRKREMLTRKDEHEDDSILKELLRMLLESKLDNKDNKQQ